MRVVNVMISKTLGGVEQAFLDYNQALSSSGHQVIAIADKNTRLKDKLEQQNLYNLFYIHFNRYNYILILSLYAKLKKFAPDIIITHSKKAIPLLRVVANWLKIPLVGVSHNPKYKLVNRCDAIFSISSYQKKIFVNYGFPESKIFVIPNCIAQVDDYHKREWHHPPVIGTMGRFDPMKGFDVYLKSVALLKQRGYDFKAVLGGGVQSSYPHEEKKLIKIIQDYNLQNCVHMAGWISDKNKFYNDIDIFTLPSNYEPFGIVLLEAMQASLPIVTSNAEGPVEIFSENADAVYMFEKGNVEDLAAKLALALENKNQTQIMAQRSWQLCKEKYSIDAVSKILNKALTEMVKPIIETDVVQRFLENEVFFRPITVIKRFGKGQLSAFYVKLSDETELTVKFYAQKEKVQYAYDVAQILAQNKELKVPRLYKLPQPYFEFEGYYGLCFYYLDGKEISASKLDLCNLKEVADAHAAFQNSFDVQNKLKKDIPVNAYLQNLRDNFLNLTSLSSNKFSCYLFNLMMSFARKFVSDISEQHLECENIPQKIIHGDITKSNMLFKNGHFESFIDTDSVFSSYIGRDFAEFIISSVLHYPFYKNKRKSITEWYRFIDAQYHLSLDEYIYGLDIYYLYRLQCRIKAYQTKFGVSKFLSFLEFLRLRNVVVRELKKLKTLY